MAICNKCYIPMVEVMSFSKDKHEKFCQCSKCNEKTKPVPIKDSDLTFGELLHKAVKTK